MLDHDPNPIRVMTWSDVAALAVACAIFGTGGGAVHTGQFAIEMALDCGLIGGPVGPPDGATIRMATTRMSRPCESCASESGWVASRTTRPCGWADHAGGLTVRVG